jgi:hypothetical protein
LEAVLVTLLNGLLKARKGQSRILEAVIAAVIVFIVFSVSTFLIRTSDVGVVQERADLDRLGYNVLHRLVESGTIEETLENSAGLGEAQLKTMVQKSLPAAMYFNLTVYNCTGSLVESWFAPNPPSISNVAAETDPFASSMEISSTNVIYTSKKGNIYFLVLALARAGEGG